MAELIRERYANAFFEAAVEAERLDEISLELEELKNAFLEQPDYLKILCAPIVDKKKKKELIEELLKDSFDAYLKNFMLILADNDRFGEFVSICEEFFALCDKQKNRIRVKAITALPLSDEQNQRLSAKLSQILQKEIILSNKVDSSLIGGIRLQYDNTEVDASVLSSLGALKHQIKENKRV